MRFSADCAFHIGAQHLRSGLPCQDYALAHSASARPFAIVSDGCSSGGRTDVGARIIAHASAQALHGRGRCRDLIEVSRIMLGLTPDDLLATCLSLTLQGSTAGAFVQGDGAVAFLLADGKLRMYCASWAKNMPSYPIYSEDGYSSFIAAQGGEGTGAFCILPGDDSDPTELIAVEQAADGWRFNSGGPIRAAAIFSDGVCQVDGMPWQEVVRELMSFKSTAGDFVKRRMNRFIADSKDHCGKGPIDDISMAAIIVEDD